MLKVIEENISALWPLHVYKEYVYLLVHTHTHRMIMIKHEPVFLMQHVFLSNPNGHRIKISFHFKFFHFKITKGWCLAALFCESECACLWPIESKPSL